MTDKHTDKAIIRTTGEGDLERVLLKKFWLSPLGLFYLKRLIDNRDIKTIIVSSGSTTGTGKTTLAITLARMVFYINQIAMYGEVRERWSAEKFGFVDGWDYLNYYKYEARKGDALVLDEMQHALESRRSMRNLNVELTQKWEKLRFKNVFTFGTSPGIHRLDLRANETAEILIRIVKRGVGEVYYQTQDDFTGATMWYKFKVNGKPIRLLFGPSDGPDKKAIDKMKLADNVNQRKEDGDGEVNPEKLKSNYRLQMCLNLLDQKHDPEHPFDGSQGDIASLIPKDPDEPLTPKNSMSQKWVSEIKRNVWENQQHHDTPPGDLR